MNVYTCKNFKGFYPVGTAAVVVASNVELATALLNYELSEMGLEPSAKTADMVLVDTSQPQTIILCDGNY